MTDTDTAEPAADLVLLPANVVQALARVTAEIGGIEKLTTAQRRERGLGGGEAQGITYAYRGIDQIAAAAQPLFGHYGVVIVPSVTDQSVKDITVNGKPWSDTFVTVEWSIYGPGGAQDCIRATTTGMGRDNSDKGVNKAMTTAFKNLLLRLLCIGDAKDDTDNAEPAVRSAPEPTGAPPSQQKLSEAQVAAASKRYEADGANAEDIASWIKQATNERTTKLEDVYSSELTSLMGIRKAWIDQRATRATEVDAEPTELPLERTP